MDSLPPPTTMPSPQQRSRLSLSSSSEDLPTSSPITSPSSTNLTTSLPTPPSSNPPTSHIDSTSSDEEEEEDAELPLQINSPATTIPYLTDLLNRPAIRQNQQKRAWVQAKLMAAQLEMKAQRRSRGRRQRGSLSPSSSEEEGGLMV